jgi:hypothetical protein
MNRDFGVRQPGCRFGTAQLAKERSQKREPGSRTPGRNVGPPTFKVLLEVLRVQEIESKTFNVGGPTIPFREFARPLVLNSVSAQVAA